MYKFLHTHRYICTHTHIVTQSVTTCSYIIHPNLLPYSLIHPHELAHKFTHVYWHNYTLTLSHIITHMGMHKNSRAQTHIPHMCTLTPNLKHINSQKIFSHTQSQMNILRFSMFTHTHRYTHMTMLRNSLLQIYINKLNKWACLYIHVHKHANIFTHANKFSHIY